MNFTVSLQQNESKYKQIIIDHYLLNDINEIGTSHNQLLVGLIIFFFTFFYLKIFSFHKFSHAR